MSQQVRDFLIIDARRVSIRHFTVYSSILLATLLAVFVPAHIWGNVLNVPAWGGVAEVGSGRVGQAFAWLGLSCLISFLSVLSLQIDLDALHNALLGHPMAVDAKLIGERCPPKGRVDSGLANTNPCSWALAPLRVTRAISYAVLIGLLIATATMWFTRRDFNHHHFVIFTLITGVAYIAVMLVGDYFAMRAYYRVTCLVYDPSRFPNSDQAERAGRTLSSLVDSLSDYQRILFFIDLPVLTSLILMTLHEFFVLGDADGFHVGFVAGTIAMHVMIANVVTMVIAAASSRFEMDSLTGRGTTLSDPDLRKKRRAKPIWLAMVAVALISFIGIWWLFAGHGRPATPVPIRVAVMTWGGAGPGFVGIEKHFFGKTPIELRIIDDSKARLAAFQTAEFEVLLTNPDQHPREAAMGLPGKMLFCSDVSLGADGLLAAKEVEHIQDLRGREIVYVQGSASDYMVAKALEAGGLKRSDVKLRPVDDPSTSIAALNGGAVAAVVAWEPLMSEAAKAGNARILFTSKDVPFTILGVFVAKESLIDDAQRLDDFVSGWMKSVDYCNRNPTEANTIMAKAFSVDASMMQSMMSGLKLFDAKMNLEWLVPKGTTTKLDELANDAAHYWQREGLLDGVLPAGKHWSSDAALPMLRSHVEAK